MHALSGKSPDILCLGRKLSSGSLKGVNEDLEPPGQANESPYPEGPVGKSPDGDPENPALTGEIEASPAP